MDKKMLDIYTDFLIAQNHHATATGLSSMLDGEISHDQVTRFLRRSDYGSKELWSLVKSFVRDIEKPDGVLCLDDTIEEKPYTDENDIVCWHFDHSKSRMMKGMNLLSCMVRYGDVSVPIGFEIIKKTLEYIDPKTGKKRRKSKKTKNELFRSLLQQALNNRVMFKYVLADTWFSSKENMGFIHETLKKYFILGVKSNRTVALSLDAKKRGQFHQIGHLKLEPGQATPVYLKGVAFPVLLQKKVFKNEDGSEGVLYLVTNDLELEGDRIYETYQKRWRIEEYHKSIKQNSSLAKSPTKTIRTQSNHIFASIVAYVKLEKLKIKTALNHFALKYKLIIKANKIAFQELALMKSKFAI